MAESEENLDKDAVGPEIFTFLELVNLVKSNVGSWNLFIKGLSND